MILKDVQEVMSYSLPEHLFYVYCAYVEWIKE